MFSQLVPFHSVIEDIKDVTGYTLTQNMYPKIRRLIYRAEKAIGFGGTVMLKRVKFTKEAGTLITIGDRYKLRLPQDVVKLEAIGMCKEGICPGMYRIQGDWLFFCEGFCKDEVSLVYYTLVTDGEGNPVVSGNHVEAVIAGVVFWLYKAKMFQNQGSGNMLRYYETDFNDRIGEARGDDAMPDTDEEWSKIARLMSASTREAILYSHIDNCFCDIPEDLIAEITSTPVVGGGGGYTEDLVSGAPISNTQGNGSGGGDGDGSYVDPDAPVEEPDIPVEDPNGLPTIQDIFLQVSSGVTTVLDLGIIEGYAGVPYSDPDNDALAKIKIDIINPLNKGTFFFKGVPVEIGNIILRSELANNDFVHVGGDGGEFNTDTLSFSVNDGVNEIFVS